MRDADKEDQKAHRKHKGKAGGRPVSYDKEAYKRCNVVQRSYNALNQWRRMTTRHDKPALIYRSAVVLHAVLNWMAEVGKSSLGDIP